VPTGNFGDIFAGYIAKRMGLPIRRLILATNENDILSRFITQGDYSTAQVVPTPSPSMDIQLASNFERYLFYLFDQDSSRVRQAMDELATKGELQVGPELMDRVAKDFLAGSATRQETLDTIRDFHRATGYILDPHTAVGVKVGKELTGGDFPLICLATAHPAKFGEAVQQAIGQDPILPPQFQGIENKPQRCEIIDADTRAIKDYMAKHALL
jgi:threonine synthase